MSHSTVSSDGFSGSIDLIQLADLIQLTCLAGMALSLDVESAAERGCIQVLSGRVSHAEAGHMSGEDALFAMLRWRGGRFEMQPLVENAPSSIKRGWEFLLLEAMRLREQELGVGGANIGKLEGALSLDPSYGFSGVIRNLQLSDLIQLACIAPMDRLIEVSSEEKTGRLYIQSGQVRHALVGDLQGEDALFEILQWPSGSFVVNAYKGEEEATISTPWDALLFEAMRRRDEAGGAKDEDEEEVEESLYQKVQKMKVVEKMRLAMRGDKEARGLLMREPSKLVQYAIINNPRITDGEVAVLAHSKQVDEEVLRKIAANREWMKLYPIRMALTTNPKTPLPIAMKLVSTLMFQDLRMIAKSKAVSASIAQAARKLVTAKQESK